MSYAMVSSEYARYCRVILLRKTARNPFKGRNMAVIIEVSKRAAVHLNLRQPTQPAGV